MTYNETILWTRFMQGKGVMNNFEYLYRTHRFDKRDLEQYLEDVDAEDVILSAFDFSGAGNTIFGFKYWKEMDQKWQVKLAEFRKGGSIDIPEEQVFCPHCQRVLPKSAFAYNPKGQLHKHCKECEGGWWDKQKKEREKEEKEKEKLEKEARQLEKEIGEKTAKLDRIMQVAPLEKTTKVCSHCGKRKLRSEFAPSDTSEDGLQSWCKSCQSAAESESNHVDNIQKNQLVEEVEEETPEVHTSKQAPLKPDKLMAPKLGEYDATLHYKRSQKSITFNSVLSQIIRDGEFTKCYLNCDRQHRMFLIFNRVEGANVTGASSLASLLLNVCSSDICGSLASRFNLTIGENYYLHITKNLSRTDNVVTVEVLAARTREEYLGIVQRREDAAKGKIPEFEAQEEVAPVQTPPKEEEIVEERLSYSTPLLDFELDTGKKMSAEEWLQQLLDKELASEQDLAAFLYKRGWKLQEPMRSYKKFTL